LLNKRETIAASTRHPGWMGLNAHALGNHYACGNASLLLALLPSVISNRLILRHSCFPAAKLPELPRQTRSPGVTTRDLAGLRLTELRRRRLNSVDVQPPIPSRYEGPGDLVVHYSVGIVFSTVVVSQA
jgi:hypothetical protein